MITSADCFKKYGTPTPEFERKFMGVYNIPAAIHELIKPLPAKIYCNKDFAQLFILGLINVRDRGLADQITEWGGCFNIRFVRGTNPADKRWSLHSWAVAFDINMASNPYGKPATMSPELVACFTDAGFEWGGDWKPSVCDGMHFQLKTLPGLQQFTA
ncbi:MAG: M15 family metallopeptidase [Bacteroidota bacterium]